MVEWFQPDLFIVLITVFVAVSALVRLMLQKRNQILNEFSIEARRAERKRKLEAYKKNNPV
jgi:hypothetical protein